MKKTRKKGFLSAWSRLQKSGIYAWGESGMGEKEE